jgi:hypothetical protein
VSPEGQTIVHTAPHHDDIMLSYHAAMHGQLGRDKNDSHSITNAKDSIANVTDSIDSILIGSENGVNETKGSNGSLHTNSNTNTKLGEVHNNNTNYFSYLTSGFHSVSDEFLWSKVDAALNPTSVASGSGGGFSSFIDECVANGRVSIDYDALMSEFRVAFLAKDYAAQERIENLIFLKMVASVWEVPTAVGSSNSSLAVAAALTDKVWSE